MTTRRKKMHGWVLLGASLAVGAACGSDGEGGGDNPKPADPLAHCSFEVPPVGTARPANAPTAVEAGYGSAVLPIPIGAPIGGYSSRNVGILGAAKPADGRPRRFGKGLVPTVGIHDAPRVEALAIVAGGERVVIVGVDAPVLSENTLYELETAVAADGAMRGRIVVTASHSHASWAGYQPNLMLMPGMDRPREALAQRAVAAMADAVRQSLDSLEPARIGIAMDGAFDVGDEVNSDRREDNDAILGPDGNDAGKGKDAVLWVLRVDGIDGTPIAALVDVPIHGTVGGADNPLASRDAPGAIAKALGDRVGYPVIHVQGAAGDVAPSGLEGRKACPDSLRCLDIPRLETLGARAADLIEPVLAGVQTGDRAALEVVTRSFYVGRDAVVKRPDGTELRYTPYDPDFEEPDRVLVDDGGRAKSPIDEFNTYAGAGLCGEAKGPGSLTPLPGTTGLRPYGSCLDIASGGSIIFGTFEVRDDLPLPFCDSARTTAAAIRVSGTPTGDWLIVTAPGEPSAPWAAYLRGRSPAGADRTLILGYADDHVGYLLTAEDWLAGGYESSINIWGPLEGEVIIDGILGAAAIAWTPELEDPEVGSSRFTGWSYPDIAPLTPIATTDHGTVAVAPSGLFWPDTAEKNVAVLAPQVPRAVGAARFVWLGGDPAVDQPVVVIEREAAAGTFETLTSDTGRPASSSDGLVIVTYTPEPLTSEAPAQHVYAAIWQPVPAGLFSADAPAAPFSLPLGNYRFRVEGRAHTAAGDVPYSMVSAPFEIIAAPLSALSAATRGTSAIEVFANLGSAPGLRALREGASDADVPLLGPWTVTVSFASGGQKTLAVSPDEDGKATVPLAATEVQDASSVEILDVAGNGGVLVVP